MKYWMLLWLLLATNVLAAPRSQGTPGEFDFYVLSLSWSPTFCLTHPGNEQCTGKGYGFVSVSYTHLTLPTSDLV